MLITNLRLMNSRNIDPKQRIREPGIRESGGIREAAVDDENGEQREENVEPEFSEPDVRVVGGDYAVAVSVPEDDVLLHDGLN